MNEWEAKLRAAIRDAGFKPDRAPPAVVALFRQFVAMTLDPESERFALMDFDRNLRALHNMAEPGPTAFRSPLLDEIEKQCRSTDPVMRRVGFARSDALVGPRFTAALERGREREK